MRIDLESELVNFHNPEEIIAVDVFLEGRKTRIYVGRLQHNSKSKAPNPTKPGLTTGFSFSYDKRYLYGDNSIPLGPDLPLTRKEHVSNELFPAFADRIPSRNNAAYKEYCEKFHISPRENNPIILLPTIARRGPSSFIFEPVFKPSVAAERLKEFRQELGVTLRDFAIAFDISAATVQKIESGKATGRDVLKRLEIYRRFPAVALDELRHNASRLHSNVSEKLLLDLKRRLAAKPTGRN